VIYSIFPFPVATEVCSFGVCFLLAAEVNLFSERWALVSSESWS